MRYLMSSGMGLACAAGLSLSLAAAPPDYIRDVRPVLREKCVLCHGPARQQGGLRVDIKEQRLAVAERGAASELVRRITSAEPSVRMPPWPAGLGISAAETEVLKAWAVAGAQGDDPSPPDARTVGFIDAIDRGDTGQVRKLVKDGSLVKVRDADGASPLMHAALNASADCVKLLLRHGADPNARNIEGATALIWAADDPVKTRILLAAGADVNAKTRHDGTALLAASLRYGSASVVTQLLAHGAHLDVTDTDGWTPLLRASAAGDTDTMKLVLARSSDLIRAKTVMLTPLTAAVWYGNTQAVRLLLARGAPVDEKDGFGFTPLSLAALWASKDIAELLLAVGADVNLPAGDSGILKRNPGTPLMLAAYAETANPDTVKLLIRHGAKLDFATSAGETAATRALEKGHSPVLKALLDAGAKEPVATVPSKPAPVSPVPDIRTAVERSLALLQRSDEGFLALTGCKSCHNQALPEMALQLADQRGLSFDRQAARLQSDTVALAMQAQREKMVQLQDDEGPPYSGSFALLGLNAGGYQPDSMTAAFVRNIAARKSAAGSWHPAGARPPLEYSDIATSAFAVRALRLYGAGPRSAGYEATIARARNWLAAAQPRYTDERVFQLLGLYWAGANREMLKNPATALAAEQREDGGWAQLASFTSDAYATGQALYALNQAAGLAATDPAYRHGVEFLRGSQLPDGSWLVQTHAIAIQPPLDSGFPHGRHQFISAAGTAWAAMAMILTFPPAQPAALPQ